MRFALRNIWTRKMSSFKVVLSLIIMITILCLFITYSIALEEKTAELVYSYRSGHYYSAESDNAFSDNTIENINAINNTLEKISYNKYIPVNAIYDLEVIYKGEHLRCYHSGYMNGLIPPNASDMEIVLHRGELGFVDKETTLLTTNDKMEANYRWVNPSFVSAGKMEIEPNSMLVSVEFLREYGLTTDVVGQKVNLILAGKNYGNITIAGVLSAKYYSLTGNIELPQMILSKDTAIFKALANKVQMKHIIEVNVKDYMSARSVANDMVEKAGVIKFTTGSSYGLAMASTVSLVNIVLVGVMSTVGVGIIIALLLNLMFSSHYMTTKKANYYGMIRAYGATNRRVFSIMFFEIFILSLFSLIIGYGASYGLAFVLKALLSSMLGIGVEFTPLNFGVTFISTLMFSVLLLLVVTLINYVTTIRSNVMHLLRRSIDS